MKSWWTHQDEFDGQGQMLAPTQSPWIPLSLTVTVRVELGPNSKPPPDDRSFRERRLARGLSQAQVAKRAGVGQVAVSRFERGLRVKDEDARKLQDAL